MLANEPFTSINVPGARTTQMGMYPMAPISAQGPAEATQMHMAIYPWAPTPAQMPVQTTRAQMGMYPMVPIQGRVPTQVTQMVMNPIPVPRPTEATRAQMGMYPMEPIPARVPTQATQMVMNPIPAPRPAEVTRAQMGMYPMAPSPARVPAQATQFHTGMYPMVPTPAQGPAEVPVQDYQHYSNTAIHPSINTPTAFEKGSIKCLPPGEFSRLKHKGQLSVAPTKTPKGSLGRDVMINGVSMSPEDLLDRYIAAVVENICMKSKESVPSQGPFGAPGPWTTHALDQRSEFTQAKRPREYNTSQDMGAPPPKRQRANISETSGPVEVATRNKIPAPPVTAEIWAYVRSRPPPPGCVKPQDVFRGPPPVPTVPWSFDRDISYLDQGEGRQRAKANGRYSIALGNSSHCKTDVAASAPTHKPCPRQATQLSPLQLPTHRPSSPKLRPPRPSGPALTPSPASSDHRSPRATPPFQPLLLPTPIPSRPTAPSPNPSTTFESVASLPQSSERRSGATTTSSRSHGSRGIKSPPVAFTGTLAELMEIIRQREPLVACLLEEWMAAGEFSGDTPAQLLEAIPERCKGVVEDTFKRFGFWIPREPSPKASGLVQNSHVNTISGLV